MATLLAQQQPAACPVFCQSVSCLQPWQHGCLLKAAAIAPPSPASGITAAIALLFPCSWHGGCHCSPSPRFWHGSSIANVTEYPQADL